MWGIYVNPVPLSQQALQPVAGGGRGFDGAGV